MPLEDLTQLSSIASEELSLDAIKEVIKIIESDSNWQPEDAHLAQDIFANNIFRNYTEGNITNEEMLEYSKLMVQFANLSFDRWYQ